VTESMLIDNLSVALPSSSPSRQRPAHQHRRLRHGYSSFARMVDLPIGEIKIDRSFIAGCAKQ